MFLQGLIFCMINLWQERDDPMLVTNTGIRVNKGGLTRLTNAHLQTVAPSIDDTSNIVYVFDENDNQTSR